MHSPSTVAEALRLRDEEGLGARRIAGRLGLPVSTVRDWHAGRLPWHSTPVLSGHGAPALCPVCGRPEHERGRLGASYAYLLGLYLGDGAISQHERGVYRLRIALDSKYPGIVAEASGAVRSVMPSSTVDARPTKSNCHIVSSYSKAWPCLFPQHGPGPKHQRPIFLAEWQQETAETWPDQLIKGLLQSDGCRFVNSGRNGWRHPRYAFSNVSTDITSIFCSACDRLGLRWTASFPKRESAAVSIYVSRKADVARLDEFVGPKR